ncbi:cisplatin damage response ATP-dependent DNA ligase [Derxia gummosa]|uniref:DNA ligase (ATP) n=1 Tax=Derxia gummosa DSM 723 TaxID=1121388 RepID=A0A8B6X0X3_9BURK|nr:cisplatin damage response ATP-dependent DNA ligase [Derxia gummosa]
MKAFARLYTALDASTATLDKIAALTAYFAAAPARDAAVAVYFLAGGRPRRAVPSRVLREAARAEAGLPEWLFDESYDAVGDLAETIAHILPPPERDDDLGLADWLDQRIAPLKGLAPDELAARLREYWRGLDWGGRFLLVKLIGGGFRVGVSRALVVRALAAHAGLDPKRVAERIVGYTDGARLPSAEDYLALIAPLAAGEGGGSVADAGDGGDGVAGASAGTGAGAGSAAPEAGTSAVGPSTGTPPARPRADGQPYPFFLAQPHTGDITALGDAADWLVEWKWDGIRAQAVRRAGRLWLWSRGEELVTDRFPELAPPLLALPDGTVLDGEIVVWRDGRPAPFAALQTRIGRKTLGRKLLAENPAAFIAYDLLEADGIDWRARPQRERRARLEAVVGAVLAADATTGAPASSDQADGLRPSMPSGQEGPLRLSPLVESRPAAGWPALAALREQSRERGVEGFMLKHRDSPYGIGRARIAGGGWWKWKIDPLTIDAVLIYAQAGHGRRASLHTDYTFALWADAPDGGRVLVPFAKAYSGLTDAEIREVDAIVRRITVEKFGPVRSVTPTLVMELGFEGVAPSARHKSGVAVRFPRILRWRRDKPVEEADSLAGLRRLAGLDDGG